MKVYVDELPKNCFECPCFGNDIDFLCGLNDGTKDYYLDEIDGGECPLQSLADYTKQVRKEVVQEVKEKLMDLYINGNTAWFMVEKLDKDVVWEILDKIGEEE